MKCISGAVSFILLAHLRFNAARTLPIPHPTAADSPYAQSRPRTLLGWDDEDVDEWYPRLLEWRTDPATQSLIDAYEDVSNRVASEVPYDPGLLCMSAKVHGMMDKRAPGRKLPWRLWTVQRLSHKGPNQPQYRPDWVPVPSCVPIFACEGYISTKYKFIYLRSQKSSSSTILKALTDTFCGDTGVCTEEQLTHWTEIPSDAQWGEYFVFTWVRNPWQRIASSYVYLHNFLRIRNTPEDDVPGPRCTVPMTHFAESTRSMIDACDESQCCPFYDYEKPGHWDFHFIPGHLSDQASNVFTAEGESMVDFIGRTEHIEEDWAEMVGHLRKRTGYWFPDVPLENINAKGAVRGGATGNERMDCAKHSDILNETTISLLTRQYAMDVHRFGFTLG